jgi:phage terminase small subunit
MLHDLAIVARRAESMLHHGLDEMRGVVDDRVMSRPHSLTERERAFCGHYVANGGNATQAAIKAGYSEKGASVAGTRLMKRLPLRNEIARIHAANAQVVSAMLVKAAKNGTIPEGISAADPGVAIGLTRAFQQYALVTAAAMALGEVPKPAGIIVRDPTHKKLPKVVQVEIIEADPRTAAYCADLIGHELNRQEARPSQAKTINGSLADADDPVTKAINAERALRGLDPVPEDYDGEND